MYKISIAQVLAEVDIKIKDGNPVFFELEFYKKGTSANDTERGKIVKIERASKGFKHPDFYKKNPTLAQETAREFYRLKEQGVLLIFDHDFTKKSKKNGYISIAIDLIRSYNGCLVEH